MSNIRFPVLFVYAGSDELLPLADTTALQDFLQQPQVLLFGEDSLLDCAGQQWTFDAQYRLSQTGRIWSLHEITALVQRHFFAQQQSCITKITAENITALIALVLQAADNSAN